MADIFTPTLMLTVIGAVIGAILGIASKYLAVEVDDTVVKIREILPGINCGACGYTGCDEYAFYLKDKTTMSNLCTPGGSIVSKKISELLNRPILSVTPKIAQVHCSGDSFSSSYIMDYASRPTCKDAKQFFQGRRSCTYACLGYGDCVASCVYGAISIKENIAVVDRELCTGCKMCERGCPKSLIYVRDASSKVFVGCSSNDKGAFVRKICQIGCIGCRRCEKTCTFGAIIIEDNLAVINPDICTNCEDCVSVCPTKVIKAFVQKPI